MGTLPPTATLGLVLPDPGTVQPFSTAGQNGWFQTIDTAIGADRSRLIKLELRDGGTSAQRDTVFGVPGSAADRVALAKRGATWFNIDKGWQEQYYAAYNDVGVDSATPVKETAGWAPAISAGRVLLTRFTAAVNGTGTVTKKGGKVEFATATGVLVDNCFTADFDRYELELSSSVVSSSTALEMRFRVGGVTDAASAYSYSFREITPGAAETGLGPATEMIVSRAFSGGFMLHSMIDNPAAAGRKTFMINHMFDNDTKTRIGGSQYNTAKAFDGFWLDLSGASTFTGELRIYGVVN